MVTLADLNCLLTMEEETQVDSETLTGETETEVTTEESQDNEELTKAQELAKNQKIRAEKAEKELKDLKAKQAPIQEERSGMSDKDLLFLARTDIHEDNLDELKDWAKFKKISMSEAYTQLKPKFDTDAEIRKSAEVTTTGSRRAPTGKISDEAFLKKMQSEIPEPGSADAERLFEIRHRKN